MKIDIKSIVKSLSEGHIEVATKSKTVDIRQAMGEEPKEPEPETEALESETEETEPEPETEPEDTVTEEVASEPEEEADDAPESGIGEEEEPESEPESEIEPEEESESEPDAEPEIESESEEATRSEAAPPPEPEQDAEEEPEAELDESETPEAVQDEEDEPTPEAVPDEEDEPAPEAVPDEEDEQTPEAVPDEEDESAPEAVQDEEDEPTPEAVPAAARFFHKEKLMAWGRSYGWLTGIAASFVVLIAFLAVYTTMIPRQINATINGEEFSFVTKAYTVQDFLEEENIAFCDEDYISISLTAFIQDGITFELRHATDFTVTADGETKRYKTLDNTVQQALDDIGLRLGERDIVTPSLDAMLTKDMEITVQRVVATQETVEEKIPFKTINKDDTSMNEGTTKVVTEGKDGVRKVTYEVIYTDGKETSRKVIARETVTAAVDEVIANGTRVNYNGQVYSRKLVVKAYAYTGGGITAMGTRARVGEIAVDPSVIPLGTNVYIEGVGARRAEDTGGNIKGNTIDIYMNTQAECLSWGVRYVTIYIQ